MLHAVCMGLGIPLRPCIDHLNPFAVQSSSSCVCALWASGFHWRAEGHSVACAAPSEAFRKSGNWVKQQSLLLGLLLLYSAGGLCTLRQVRHSERVAFG